VTNLLILHLPIQSNPNNSFLESPRPENNLKFLLPILEYIKIAKHIIKSFKYCKKFDKAVLIYIVKKNDYPEIAFLYLNFPYYYNAEEEKCKSNFSELLEETQIVKNGSI